MKFQWTIRKKLFLSHFLAIVLVSGSIGSYFYFSSVTSLMESLQDRLRYSAALISRTIDAAELYGIDDESDTSDPAYLKTLSDLRTYRRMNQDIAYLYIMHRVGEKVYFVVDSDETEAQALPGREYEETVPTLMAGFTGISVDDRIYSDEWGSFLSGYAPIKNGMGEYLVGIDMRATEVQKKFQALRISGIVSLACSVLLAMIFSTLLASRLTVPISMLISRCRAIADGRLDQQVDARTNDELNDLIDAFNGMSQNLSDSELKKQRAHDALERARDELEIRVEQRTRDLKEVNEQLSQEVTDRIRAEKALEQAAMTDPLTGLLNRRAITGYLRHEMARNKRIGAPFAVLLADLDHFKDINDLKGHDVGDEVLIETARRLRNIIRGQDTVSRWGGEEFLLLLPDTDLSGGMIVAEKIRRRVADETYLASGKIVSATISIGAAQYQAGQSIDDCIKAADVALYNAKARGRNRVESQE